MYLPTMVFHPTQAGTSCAPALHRSFPVYPDYSHKRRILPARKWTIPAIPFPHEDLPQWFSPAHHPDVFCPSPTSPCHNCLIPTPVWRSAPRFPQYPAWWNGSAPVPATPSPQSKPYRSPHPARSEPSVPYASTNWKRSLAIDHRSAYHSSLS